MNTAMWIAGVIFALAIGFTLFARMMLNFNRVKRPERVVKTFAAWGTKTDADWVNEAKCPDCHSETLLAGPSGGMSQNVGCNTCLMEFNVHSGFGTGAFSVDRTGKMDEGRAGVFGISPEEYRSIVK